MSSNIVRAFLVAEFVIAPAISGPLRCHNAEVASMGGFRSCAGYARPKVVPFMLVGGTKMDTETLRANIVLELNIFDLRTPEMSRQSCWKGWL